jgi:hypothetical protein
MAATPELAARGAVPPAATLSTNGSMSVAPTMAASPKRPRPPNSLRTQAEASEITTNNAAKIDAAVSSSGLAGGFGSGAAR